MSQNSYEKIYEVVKQIPRGQVATYGQVAALAGNNRWARVVGYALHVNPDPEGIPCYRVVNKEGRLSDAFAFGGVNRQKLLLEAEGVRVVMRGSFWSASGWRRSAPMPESTWWCRIYIRNIPMWRRSRRRM